MSEWTDVNDGLPTDNKQKLVTVYNYFQHRNYLSLAWYTGSEWTNRGGKVIAWMDLPEPWRGLDDGRNIGRDH